MARPVQYAQPRVDTKVRLRADHAALLAEAQVERTLGRNRLIEMALDQFFGITGKGHAPKLARPDPSAAIGASPRPGGRTRTTPRVQHVGEAQARASQEALEAGSPVRAEVAPRTRRSPRPRL